MKRLLHFQARAAAKTLAPTQLGPRADGTNKEHVDQASFWTCELLKTWRPALTMLSVHNSGRVRGYDCEKASQISGIASFALFASGHTAMLALRH